MDCKTKIGRYLYKTLLASYSWIISTKTVNLIIDVSMWAGAFVLFLVLIGLIPLMFGFVWVSLVIASMSE